MTLDDTIRRLLAQLPDADQLDFFRLLDAVHSIRFTGPVTIDFLNGEPRQINLGQPVKLTICRGEPHPLDTRGLDKPAPVDRS